MLRDQAGRHSFAGNALLYVPGRPYTFPTEITDHEHESTLALYSKTQGGAQSSQEHGRVGRFQEIETVTRGY